jgi:hypothetical protein
VVLFIKNKKGDYQLKPGISGNDAWVSKNI